MAQENLYDLLMQDVRFEEGLHACMNCGICTAICPAAEFYNYDPRVIVDTVQSKNEIEIEKLLKSEEIWYCGECMSCKTRCPRGNTPGLVIMALRGVSQDKGFFIESEKGRQQLAVKRVVGENIVKKGYCVLVDNVVPETHPEQGPMWEWVYENRHEVLKRVGANYQGDGPGALRKIPQESLDELQRIFDITGGTKRFEDIEKYSKIKAAAMHMQLDNSMDNEYIKHVYTYNNNEHTK